MLLFVVPYYMIGGNSAACEELLNLWEACR
jgi:hypothetical protein